MALETAPWPPAASPVTTSMTTSATTRPTTAATTSAPDPETATAITGATAGARPGPASHRAAPVNLLAYVHLRNIHRSTGAGRVARLLVEHLAARADVNLEVLADARDQARIVPVVGEPWTSYPYRLFTAETSRQQARWFLTGRPAAEQFWPEADLVFCTAESFVPVRKAKLVVTVHDAAYFEDAAHARDWAFHKQRLKWTLLYRRLERTADMLHTVSAFSAERLAHFFPALGPRLRVVPNGVAPHFFGTPAAEGIRFVEEAELAGRRFVLLPGGLHYRKNAELVLGAMPLLLEADPELAVVLVNHSDPLYAARARALGPRARMLGFVPDPALHALYQAAEVTWFPSRYEGFGMPVLESMASGTPVVASQASSIPEVAGGAALLVDPGSPRAHAEAILGLLSDPCARAEHRRAGLARARGYTWTAAAATWKGYVDELL